MVGLAASGIVALPMVVPVLFVGADLAYFASPVGLGFQVAGVFLLLALLVIGGHAFTGIVSLGLRNRRTRDLAFVFVALLGLGIYASYQTIATSVSGLGLEGALDAHPLSPWWWLIPPVSAQQAIVTAGAGLLADSFLHLLAATAWLIILTGGWYTVIDRLVTTPQTATTHLRRSRVRAGWGSPTGAIFAKEIRFYLRDPRLRMVWTGGAVFIALLVASLLLGTARIDAFRHIPWLTLAAPAVVLFVGLPVTLNQFGWERNAASFVFSLPVTPRDLLRGKSRAAIVVLLIEGTLMSLAFAAISGGWRWLPYTVPITLTAIGCQLAVGNVISALTPLRLPPMGTDLFSQATEQGCLAVVSQAFAFFVIGLMLIPTASAFIVVAAGYLDPMVVSLASVLWGGVMYRIGLGVGTQLLARRMPELLEAVQTRA